MVVSRQQFGRRTVSFTRRIAWLIASVTLTMAVSAMAQENATETEVETARRQYREGVSLEAAGDWALALKKFEAVARVRLTPQVRFHIARNKENLGRLTEALGDYRLAEYEAKDVNEEELRKIREARESLESRIPRLQVTADSSVAGATVTLDGVELGRERLVEALPVDPGSHRVVVRFEDGRDAEYVVQVAEGQTEVLQIRDQKRDLAAVPPPPPPQPPPKVDAPAPWWPWAAGGVGVAGLVGGSVLLYLRQDAIDTLEANCTPSGICRDDLRGTYDNGQTYSVLAPIALGVGVAGIGAAVVGLLLDGPEASAVSQRDSSLALDVDPVSDQLGVRVRGEF